MMNLSELIRPNIKKLKPYSSARDEFKGNITDVIFLDANENPFETGLNRYPDPQQLALKTLIAEQKGVAVSNILLGNGSDEVLDLIIRVFCEPNSDKVITLPPTYGMYQVLADINAIEVIQVELNEDFQPRVEAILKTATSQTKLLFLCSPNNPTANCFNAKKIETLVREFSGIVVIDEAYVDFSSQESWLSRLDEFPNLIVTQTLSKAYGLAGIRLGMCFASSEIISILNSIKPPYNVNQLTQQKAIEILTKNKTKEAVKTLILERQKLELQLKALPMVKTIYPSDANFLLVKVDDAQKRYQQLKAEGVIVRNRSHEPLCDNCLRFTVGTAEENKKLIDSLNKP